MRTFKFTITGTVKVSNRVKGLTISLSPKLLINGEEVRIPGPDYETLVQEINPTKA